MIGDDESSARAALVDMATATAKIDNANFPVKDIANLASVILPSLITSTNITLVLGKREYGKLKESALGHKRTLAHPPDLQSLHRRLSCAQSLGREPAA